MPDVSDGSFCFSALRRCNAAFGEGLAVKNLKENTN